jgi:hypothetical protein
MSINKRSFDTNDLTVQEMDNTDIKLLTIHEIEKKELLMHHQVISQNTQEGINKDYALTEEMRRLSIKNIVIFSENQKRIELSCESHELKCLLYKFVSMLTDSDVSCHKMILSEREEMLKNHYIRHKTIAENTKARIKLQFANIQEMHKRREEQLTACALRRLEVDSRIALYDMNCLVDKFNKLLRNTSCRPLKKSKNIL